MHPLNPASLDNGNINNNGLSIKKNNKPVTNISFATKILNLFQLVYG